MTDRKEKIVIVGAGMAGLTAAAYLLKNDYDVLLLEKNDRTGGLVNTFEREGFSFDTGPRAFVNSGMVQPMLDDLEIDYEVVNNEISIAIEDQMIRIDSLSAINDYKRILLALYPESAADIEKIIKVIYKLSKDTAVLYEFDNPNFKDYTKDKKVLLTKLLPWSFKFLNSLRRFNKFNMPMEDYLKGLTDNQSLIDILTQFFFRKTPTYFALGYFYVYLDYFYPKNGTIALPQILHKRVIENGGVIQLNTRIQEVIPSQKKVIDAEGKSYEYDHLIWATDLKTLYRQIDPAGLDENTTNNLNTQSQIIESSKAAESVFIMFLAVDRPSSYFKDKSGEHMFFTPSKKGLGDTNHKGKQYLVDNFDSLSKNDVYVWLDDFCNLNTYEVSIPSLRDSSLSPEGQTGIMISCLFDYEVAEKISEAGWIDEFKTAMEDRIVKIFSQTIFEDMDKDLLFKLSTTPLTINKITGNSAGAIVGWSFETKAPVYNRLKDLPKSVLTPIPEIYQASQWAYAPAGVPIAMLTGWYATQKIMKKSKK